MGMNDSIGGKLVGVGALILLVQNLLWVVLLIMAGGGDNSSSEDPTTPKENNSPLEGSGKTLLVLLLVLDGVAMIIVGVGFLFIHKGMGPGDNIDLNFSAKMAGIFSLSWGFVALLWHIIIPLLSFGMFYNMLGADPDTIETSIIGIVIAIRLMYILMLVSFFLFPVAFFFIRKYFQKLNDQHNLPPKTGLLTILLSGAGMNLLGGAIIALPLMPTMLAGEPPATDSEGLLMVGLLFKILATPILMLIGSIGLFKAGFSLGSISAAAPSTQSPTGTGAYPGASPSPVAGGLHRPIGGAPVGGSAPGPGSPPGGGPLCIGCGKTASFIAEYDRHYCHTCKEYLPEASATPAAASAPSSGAGGAPTCKSCGQPGTFIAEYNRHYCHPCKAYL